MASRKRLFHVRDIRHYSTGNSSTAAAVVLISLIVFFEYFQSHEILLFSSCIAGVI